MNGDGNMYSFRYRIITLVLLASLLHLLLVVPLKARESEYSPRKDVPQERIEAWTRQIMSAPDARYKLLLINGDSVIGWVDIQADGLRVEKMDKSHLTRKDYDTEFVSWDRIRSIEQHQNKINVGGTVKVCSLILGGLLVVLYCLGMSQG